MEESLNVGVLDQWLLSNGFYHVIDPPYVKYGYDCKGAMTMIEACNYLFELQKDLFALVDQFLPAVGFKRIESKEGAAYQLNEEQPVSILEALARVLNTFMSKRVAQEELPVVQETPKTSYKKPDWLA